MEPSASKPEWPAAAIESWSLNRIIPYARNPRTHDSAQIAGIAASIREWGWTTPLLVDEQGSLIAGHGRLLAARQLGFESVPVMVARGWSEVQKRAYVIADNKLALNAGWDPGLLFGELTDLNGQGFDLGLTGFTAEEFAEMLEGPGDVTVDLDAAKATLADRFGIAPFSVLNAREGWWQARKKAWLALGIRSEVGRGENLLRFSETINEPDPEKRKKRFNAQPGQHGRAPETESPADFTARIGEEKKRKRNGKEAATMPRGGPGEPYRPRSSNVASGVTFGGMNHQDGADQTITGTSIFDPVLCELAYRWFCPAGGLVLDPFAGGSVRGIVASKLGRRYVGVDLSQRQIDANREQANSICAEPLPIWAEGDSRNIGTLCGEDDADMIFTCPPYADLEVYSDDPRDLSTLGYAEFVESYQHIIRETCRLLRRDRFACVVVGEVRGKAAGGAYYGFVPDTIEAFRSGGLEFYNEAILVTAAGSLPIRAGKQFEVSRKLGKTHQNILVFVKGDPRKATEACGSCEFDDKELLPDGMEKPAEEEFEVES